MLKKAVIFTSLLVLLFAVWTDKASDFLPAVIRQFFIQRSPAQPSREVLLTLEELQLYNGKDRPELYLSILGEVFDVTKGAKHYGDGCQYNFFVGKDASRNFITGNFNDEDASDQVADLSHDKLLSLKQWKQFYRKHYTKVGKLIGTYYDENGQLTPHGKVVKDRIKAAKQKEKDADLQKRIFPPCNLEWTQETGTRVWCTELSGGISRDWVGVPRQLYEPGSKSYRCACISDENKELGSIKEYDDCDPTSTSCFIKI
ncbi:unnamed protein product [Acanthoscelides obtectus]|uniref:Cytochrome b5 heme-binding domain-containing protein n=1 Tax=Acanthoscelides obtectus TaxID=200917 RepID=A0A9P0Q261_ACAOB|nr:unnamed protein product [Acanthoscelides obtectus]CAK1619903.1 Neuferricin [Acanthoscelides obtectus]